MKLSRYISSELLIGPVELRVVHISQTTPVNERCHCHYERWDARRDCANIHT